MRAALAVAVALLASGCGERIDYCQGLKPGMYAEHKLGKIFVVTDTENFWGSGYCHVRARGSDNELHTFDAREFKKQ